MGEGIALPLRRRQAGQAIVLGIVALLFGVLVAIAVFNTGQGTSEKTRLVNAADAAAYSAAVWEARTLNFQAYANRAMVANQVAIAQVISFVSWTQYAERLAIQIDEVAKYFEWIPYIGPIIKEITATIRDIMSEVADIVVDVAEVGVQILDGLIDGLSAAEKVAHYAGASVARQIMDEVVKRNDPDYRLTSVSDIFWATHWDEWSDFTSTYDDEDSDELSRQEAVIMASRDGWTQGRNWDMPDGQKIYMSSTERFVIKKRGETRHIDLVEWKAKDTVSSHLEVFTCKKGKCRWVPMEEPFGWGGAYSSEEGDQDQSDYWSENREAEKCLEQSSCSYNLDRSNEDFVEVDGYSGLRAYRDMADLSEDNKDPRLAITVEVAKDGAKVRTARQIGIGAGQFRLDDDFTKKNEMAALSKAEVYFKRPVDRADGKEEYGNLFNPYWHARLVPVGRTERLTAWAPKVNDSGGLFAALFQ